MFENIPVRLGDSKYLPELAVYYRRTPPSVLLRTAEIELIGSVPIEPPALDLCCGDGYFMSLLGPDIFESGCDFSETAVNVAKARGIYKSVEIADITKNLPYPSSSFKTVVSNSSLEHVADIDAALGNVRKVLKPGGRLIFTLASNFAYEWWICGPDALKNYLAYQPVFSYFALNEWEAHLKKAGLELVAHQYYLSRQATKLFTFMDYHFSRVYMTSDRTIARPVIKAIRKAPSSGLSFFWRKLFGNIRILANDEGGEIMIIAKRDE